MGFDQSESFLDIGHVLAGKHYRTFYSPVWMCSGNDVDFALASISPLTLISTLMSTLTFVSMFTLMWNCLAPEPFDLREKSDPLMLRCSGYICV